MPFYYPPLAKIYEHLSIFNTVHSFLAYFCDSIAPLSPQSQTHISHYNADSQTILHRHDTERDCDQTNKCGERH